MKKNDSERSAESSDPATPARSREELGAAGAGKRPLCRRDPLSVGRWQRAAAAGTGAGAGAGGRGARSASRSEPSCVHARRVYKRVLLTYANRVLSSALGRFCLKS